MAGNLDWLLQKMEGVEEEELKIPTGGDFTRGFVGEWVQRAMFKLYMDSSLDLKEEGIKFDRRVPTLSENGAFYYWYQKAGAMEEAQKACSLIDWKAPNNVWHWEMPVSTLLNWQGDDENLSKLGDSVSFDVDLVGLLSIRRTEFHLLFLPSMAQAIGLAGGILSEQVYNYENLIFRPEDVTHEYCERLVGPVSGKDAKYEEGELWNARTEIWAAFGEENPKAWTTGRDPKTDTSSEKLAIPLGILTKPGIALWSRMTRVAAPSMPTDKDKERDRFPFGMNVVSQVWAKREDAVKDTDVGEDIGGLPAIPAEWSGTSIGDFRDWVNKYVADNFDGKTKDQIVKAVKKDKGLEDSLALTADELVPWIEAVME